MADENTGATPQDGMTVDPTVETQPQVDPTAAPDGTTVADDLQGTTGDPVSEKEQLAQTRYQNLIENLKAQGIDPDKINEWKQPAGSLADALPADMFGQQPQQPAADLTPHQQDAEDQGFDPYDPDQMKMYLDQNFGQIRGQLKDTVRGVVTEVREEENFRAEWQAQQAKFDDWAEKNGVPLEQIKKAVDKQLGEIGWGKTPSGFMNSVKRILKEHGALDAKLASQEAIKTAAVDKAAALAGVTQPAAGAPPNPAAPKVETPQQKLANDIVPDEAEPKYT